MVILLCCVEKKKVFGEKENFVYVVGQTKTLIFYSPPPPLNHNNIAHSLGKGGDLRMFSILLYSFLVFFSAPTQRG